jgi:hypothetical protein
MFRFAIVLTSLLACSVLSAADDPLAVGIAGHAFDHLGNLGEQSEAAAASGANIIYATGVGGLGYAGLPPAAQLAEAKTKAAAYVKNAKAHGIQLAVGYVCATSIVNLDTFDKNWQADLRAQLKTPPAQWLQQDKDGKPLPSWYGGDYRPACVNNPDWRTYEKYIVRLQLEAGHDGIFFDNPTVHPDGCYCDYCMKAFRISLGARPGPPNDVAGLRSYAQQHKAEFLRFRSTIAADFLGTMRDFARSINPKALITCNNSLNSPEAIYSQCRTYGYDIEELSKVEDLIVIEDMATQPRVTADGAVIEYGPVYEMLHAIAHDKPIVAVVLADGDYHTPPNLMRLAMAEAAAHEASYLSWPTWPQNERKRMTDALRPQAEFLRAHADLLNGTKLCADVVLALPFEQWLQSENCPELNIARHLAAANVQFQVQRADSPRPIDIQSVNRSVTLPDGPPTVRVVVRQKDRKTIVHVLNLNVQRISSFRDQVKPVENLRVQLRVDAKPKKLTALSADESATRGEIDFKSLEGGRIEFTVPHLEISTILVIE